MSDSINLADGLTASPGKWRDMFSKKKTAQEWIPVSERLPEKSGWYIITYTNEFVQNMVSFALFIEADPNSKTSVGHFDGYISRSVTAWMPLPEPFEGGDAE